MPPTTLQVALNGGVGDHRMPRTPQETARQAAASVAEGATSIHLHAYDDDGVETLEAGSVAATLTPPGPAARGSVLPDLVPADQGEDGIGELAAMLAARGVGVATWSVLADGTPAPDDAGLVAAAAALLGSR
ncbi:3-keto-5-aminohexanoate cleavage protein [Nocardioides aquaticus]|uniref:3-keto-5-aminohexanoate cleavage protein n=1 Tax=Nocardioides aquaticus TaxID=160826 RepID=UPI001BD5628F|nr:3-keto-5-aminohexanoate cleavage protein [Nocardioides aquaticus]